MADAAFNGSTAPHDDLAYGRSVVRPVSPDISIDTEYGPDETSPDEKLLTDEQFEKETLRNLHIGEPTDTERWQDTLPVRYPNARPGSQEEESMYLHTLWALQKLVDELEEQEIFEDIILRGSQISLETFHSSDIDSIMRSMTEPPRPAHTLGPLRIRQSQTLASSDQFQIPSIISETILGSARRLTDQPSYWAGCS